jgi:hypothetical protein
VADFGFDGASAAEVCDQLGGQPAPCATDQDAGGLHAMTAKTFHADLVSAEVIAIVIIFDHEVQVSADVPCRSLLPVSRGWTQNINSFGNGLIHRHRVISPAITARPWTARVAVNLGHPNCRMTSRTRAS